MLINPHSPQRRSILKIVICSLHYSLICQRLTRGKAAEIESGLGSLDCLLLHVLITRPPSPKITRTRSHQRGVNLFGLDITASK